MCSVVVKFTVGFPVAFTILIIRALVCFHIIQTTKVLSPFMHLYPFSSFFHHFHVKFYISNDTQTRGCMWLFWLKFLFCSFLFFVWTWIWDLLSTSSFVKFVSWSDWIQSTAIMLSSSNQMSNKRLSQSFQADTFKSGSVIGFIFLWWWRPIKALKYFMTKLH